MSNIKSDSLKKFPEQLKKFIESTDENGSQIAKKIGITPSSLSSMKTGKSNPSNQTLLLLQIQYGLNPDYLLTGEGEMFQEKKSESAGGLSLVKGVCESCGQEFGLQALLESKAGTIQDKEEILKMKDIEIGRLKEEILGLERFRENRTA